jgi:hypothetical protein
VRSVGRAWVGGSISRLGCATRPREVPFDTREGAARNFARRRAPHRISRCAEQHRDADSSIATEGKGKPLRFIRTNAVALAALVFAMSGTTVAASHYVITSTHQIKPRVLRVLKGGVGPKGAPGVPGPAGPIGPAGPANLTTLTTALYGGSVPAGQIGQVSAFCPPGSRAVSGGGESGIAHLEVSEMMANNAGWFIIVNNESATTVPIHAEAYCGTEGRAVVAAHKLSRLERATRDRDETMIANLTARLVDQREAARARDESR